MNAAPILTMAALCALLVAPAQAGKLYKWVDKHGNVSYQDQPPPPEAGHVEEKTLRGTTAPAAPEGPKRPPVILYVVPDCSSCDLMRAALQRRKVAFSEKNVEGNVPVQTELKNKSGALSVPTVTVGDKVVKGHAEAALNAELDAAGYEKTGNAAGAEKAESEE